MITIYSESKKMESNHKRTVVRPRRKIYRFYMPSTNTDFSTGLESALLGQFKRPIIESMRALYPEFVYRSICIVMEDINKLCAATVVNKMILRECVQSHFFLCFNKESNYSDVAISMRKIRTLLGALFEGIHHITNASVQLPPRNCVFLSNIPVYDIGVECFELSTGQYLIDARRVPPGTQLQVGDVNGNPAYVNVQ